MNASKKAVNMVGDGKTPNKYFVTIHSDYYLHDPVEHTLDWASDVKKIKTKGKTIKMFNNYQDAKRFAESIRLGDKMNGITVNTIMVEDRLSGEVFERSVGGHQTEDIKFIADTEAKRHVKSTLLPSREREKLKKVI